MAEIDNSTAELVQKGADTLNRSLDNFTTTARTKSGTKLDYEYWQKSVDYQNKINLENYEKQKKDNYDLALNSKQIEVQALRNAGLNPAWSQDGAGGVVSTSSSAPTAPDAPSGQFQSNISKSQMDSFNRTMQMQQMDMNLAMQKAQIDNLESQSKKNNAESENISTNTTFLPELLGSQIGVNTANARKTNADAELQERVNGYFATHPESFAAIQDYQKEMIKNLGKQRELMDSQRKNVDMDTSKKAREKELLLYDMDLKVAQSVFTTAQMEVLKDRNFCEHYNDPAWLLREIDDTIDDLDFDNVEEANEKLALLRMAYENCSSVSSDTRKYLNQLGIQENDLEYKYASLGADVFGNIVKNIRKAHKTKVKPGTREKIGPRTNRDIWN